MNPTAPYEIRVGSSFAPREREAFAHVFRQHHEWALGLAYLLCGNPHRAEEVVAEAFAKTWPRWRRGAVRDERAYLRRAIINELRSLARRRVVERRDLDRRAQERARPAAELERLEDRERLLVALTELPVRQRAVIVLRFNEDLTEATTAEMLGVRVGTVKSQTSRALARLRTTLGEG